VKDYVLRTNGISKRYKKQLALDDVSISIKRGSIYGFIGQNGAGKSTLIKLITGLAYPTQGSLELFGSRSKNEFIEARKRIGSIIEGPALYPHMTARENLEAFRILKGIPGNDCVDKTLKLVGLEETGKKKAKNFSLGMKQRLGIAIALLSNPEFLILDEPINGLDPMGVVEVRDLLLKLNKEQGISIMISSHILSELHLLATHFGFIHKGRLIEETTAKELEIKCRHYLHIKTDNPNQAAAILEQELSTTDYHVMADGIIHLYKYMDQPGLVSTALASNGAVIEQLMPMGENLESYFTALIGGTNHE
jgi:ABC-2 type transport system ATP-binding protein